jgi:tRNA G18 (ribose-2'-O)-methylase SpoU
VGLTDVDLRRRTEAERGCFIVEGPLAIERLEESPYRARAFLLTPKMAERLGPVVGGAEAPVYVADPEVLAATVGFDLHRGAVASAQRPEPATWRTVAGAPALLVVEGVNDHENLGALFRNAAAFGVGGVLLDPTCADPLYRRCVRVSMGHVLRIPFARLEPWPSALHELDATVIALAPSGEADLASVGAPERLALLVGAEGPGLTGAALATARLRVRIPMADGADSLNVATAAAVALHHLRRR